MRESSETLNTQAIDLAQQGFYSEAVACLRRATVIDKENYLLWYNLGITYRDAGNLEDAKTALMKAYQLNDCDVELLETLSLVFYALGNLSEAFAFCYESLDLNPMNARSWNNLGVFYFAKENYEQASQAFETALSFYPHYYDALFNLKDAYAELGNKKGQHECEILLKELEK
mgnify:CR=1 FL=1